MKIAPSILSADFAKLGEAIKMVVDAGAEYIHIDIMDGHFVPNLSFGAPIVSAVRPVTKAVFDVHLMVEAPEDYVEPMAKAGADIFTFHAEATVHAHRMIQSIKAAGMKAGIALNPATPLSAVEEVLADVDMVLIMTVNPGFGGQKFIESMTDKIVRLKRIIDERGLSVDIEVDGGINVQTADSVKRSGANVLVAGSAVYGAADPAAVIAALKA